MELTIAQFWSSLGESSIDIDISYHGIQVAPSSILLDGNAKIKKVLLRCDSRSRAWSSSNAVNLRRLA